MNTVYGKIINIRGNNIDAVKSVTELFKERKCLSRKDFQECVLDAKDMPHYYTHPNNFIGVESFMLGHGLITKQEINGYVVWVATKKLVLSSTQPWFPRTYEIERSQMTEALTYQKTNDGKLDFRIEGNIIAKNIFKFKNEAITLFVNSYAEIMERCKMDKMTQDYDRAIINTIEDMDNVNV